MWDDDVHYPAKVRWSDLKRDGIKIGSFYSNSVGLLRRELWESYKFTECMNGMEDFDWALYNLKSGRDVARCRCISKLSAKIV